VYTPQVSAFSSTARATRYPVEELPTQKPSAVPDVASPPPPPHAVKSVSALQMVIFLIICNISFPMSDNYYFENYACIQAFAGQFW
jgi:hypothetical protein